MVHENSFGGMRMANWLAALPVYNEEGYVDEVLNQVTKYADNILVVNDGSTDGTSERLAKWENISVVHHDGNKGYGAALKSAFRFAIEHDYEYLITLDCDGQHQPQRIPRFLSACRNTDIVSGSRYLKTYEGDSQPPAQRLFINRQITRQINQRLGYKLTDAFCGFKAYRVEALKLLDIQDDGYAMPLELWVQAAMNGLRVLEVPVPLIYLDLNRSFGGALDEAEKRLQYYNECIERSITAMRAKGFELPARESACQGCP
jgi:glycosyltransferase involved in cell wall biosynthesis